MLPPGSRLKISELSKSYASGPVPIREALQTLVGEGLVVIHPHKGASVQLIEPRIIEDMLEVRRALEPYINAAFVRNASINVIRELEAIEDEFEKFQDAGDIGSYVRADQEFHTQIYRMSGNAEAMYIINRHFSFIGAHLSRYGQSAERMQQVRSEHRRQIAALKDGDATTAAEIAILHLANAIRDLREIASRSA